VIDENTPIEVLDAILDYWEAFKAKWCCEDDE
jgi:hypothetical protein